MEFFKARKIEIVCSSGTLRVTVPPKYPWISVPIGIAGTLFFASILYNTWAKSSFFIRTLYVWAFVGGALALVYQLSGREIIEFSSDKLAVCKDVHGWERKKEYRTQECSGLEWEHGGEDWQAGLKCKIGLKTIRFGEGLSEDESIEILVALDRHLPEVARRICSYPDTEGEHFITLGLGNRR
jgi:hypothetical protein